MIKQLHPPQPVPLFAMMMMMALLGSLKNNGVSGWTTCFSHTSRFRRPLSRSSYSAGIYDYHLRIYAPSISSSGSRTFAGSNSEQEDVVIESPYANPQSSSEKSNFRARQHVNPLARNYQIPTVFISSEWPRDVFDDLSRPLFLDIGCARGGFLLKLVKDRQQQKQQELDEYNYLGLEIRPSVAHLARERIAKRDLTGKLDFVGCNANVDLERLLTLYEDGDKNDGTPQKDKPFLHMVTIQFPDPHFKNRHSKRRVVTDKLVQTLARFMPPGATIFLQSDIQTVLDQMRSEFRNHGEYFVDAIDDTNEYLEENLLGVPTEREVGVLAKGLPVFRTTFTRTKNKMSLP